MFLGGLKIRTVNYILIGITEEANLKKKLQEGEFFFSKYLSFLINYLS